MKDTILGFEKGTGATIKIKPSHLIATGVTQLSGKTTTLEALINRSGARAIVFKTKVGETGFSEGTLIPPFFKERADWQYVESLLEATMKERLKFERSWIIRACQGKFKDAKFTPASTLLEVKANVDTILLGGKLRQFDKDIFTNLQAYFEIVLPQLQYSNFSKTLDPQDGINIMDLERFKEEIQSLVIRSVLEEVLNKQKNTIVVIPEAWKFMPQGRGNPCKHAAEDFIRQGATNENFLWFDSQDMTGVDKGPLKQVSTWILGLQTEKNEVQRTLDQISVPKKQKPLPEEIMTLEVGHFIYVSPRATKRVYVWPAWLSEKEAKLVAKGELDVSSLKKPKQIAPFGIQYPSNAEVSRAIVAIEGPSPKIINGNIAALRKEIAELREDFFNKIGEAENAISGLFNDLSALKLKQPAEPVFDEDIIVSKVLQKMPLQKPGAPVDTEAIIQAVLSRVPSGGKVYTVAPIEKLRRGFLEKAKDKILLDVSTLDMEQKKVLKFIETQEKGCTQTMILSKCLYLAATSGGTRSRISKKCRDMANLELMRMDKNAICYPHLKERIKALLGVHNAPADEVEQVYNHILMEILKDFL